MVKLGADTLLTVPDAPPWDGGDRTLEPPLSAVDESVSASVVEDASVVEGAASVVSVVEGVVSADEDDEHPTESAAAPDISAAATIHPATGGPDVALEKQRAGRGWWRLVES